MSLLTLLYNHHTWYYGWRRIFIHVLFWIIVFSYEAVQTSFTIERTDLLVLFTLREVVTIMLIHYFLAYYAIPKLLLRYKWFYFILCIIASYIVLMAGMYYSLYFLRVNNLVTGYLVQTAAFFLEYDFFTTLISPDRMYNIFNFNMTLVISLLIKITISFYYSSIRRLNLEKNNIKLEKEKTKMELDFLKSQINPHFFFNTLNSIYSLVEGKDELAASIVLKLSDLMRYSLYESNHTKIPLLRELQFIQDYVKLEKIRHKEHIVIEMDIQPIPDGLEIAPMFLITFVENAFKHGVNSTINASWVRISASVQDTTLTFIVKNSKPGKLRQETVQGGIGLVNVRRRLDLLYPERYQLTVQNLPSHYIVNLTLVLYENPTQLRDRRRRTPRAEPHREIY